MAQAAAAPSPTIELPVEVTAWGVNAALLCIILWFLRREIANNDQAHARLNKRIDDLLNRDGGNGDGGV